MSKVKDAIAEHCERYCVPSCDNCFPLNWTCSSLVSGCPSWECGCNPATCFEDAQAAEADRIHDAVKDGGAA